ncbi:MAG: DUF1848 domain-containing protein [Leptospirales bacterium]
MSQNRPVSSSFPFILSASRRTDIPAFYAKQFIRDFRSGTFTPKNPFNGKPYTVHTDNVKCIVFWTKNPDPILPYLKTFTDNDITFYFQYSLNNYEKEKYEQGLPNLEHRLNSFYRLSEKIGPERVIWRYDPILLTNDLTIEKTADRIRFLAERLQGYTRKLVYSFARIDEYKKVLSRMNKNEIAWRKPQPADITHLGKLFKELTQFKLEVNHCCEPPERVPTGIHHNKCIDPDLISSLLKNISLIPKLKDPGQRNGCGCIQSKDIGAYNSCHHRCVYCYAGFAKLK